jgi:hypothetical protein
MTEDMKDIYINVLIAKSSVYTYYVKAGFYIVVCPVFQDEFYSYALVSEEE